MMTAATFTLGQLFNMFLVMCGGLITVSGAIGVIVTIVRKATMPNQIQNERLSELEEKINSHDDSLRSIENGNRVTQRAILALLSHGIDGNELDGMRKAKSELTEYLIER